MTVSPSVESRLRGLERSRNLLVLALAALCAGLFLVAASPRPAGPTSTITAGSFRLVDAEGAVVAVLEMGEEGPGLFLRDAEGRDRVALTHDSEESGLFVKDAVGDVRIGVAQFAHGGGGVALHGEGMKGGAVLYLKQAGSLSFYDEEGGITLRLPAAGEAP